MRAFVVSNGPSLRSRFFMEAGQAAGVEVRFVTYDTLLNNPESYADALIKLEPPELEECDFARFCDFGAAYRQLLQTLADDPTAASLRYLNTPAAILCALDKKTCKRRLKGLRVTPELPDEIHDLSGLLAQMDVRGKHAVFIKPRYGAGAGGIIALRRHPANGQCIAYTSLRAVDGRLYNTSRTHRITDMATLGAYVDQILSGDAIVEEWISKASIAEDNYDLRVVCQLGGVKHIVVRCSKGPITNLHLNNNARQLDAISLSDAQKDEIATSCREVNEQLGLSYSGIDILLNKRGIPWLIEVNGQGDHIYQDMYDKNAIYQEQLTFGMSRLCP